MAIQALPRDLDVIVNITRGTTEIATDMTMGCVLTGQEPAVAWEVGEYVRYYGSLSAFATDWISGSDLYKAGEAFFSQSPRPAQIAVGRINPIAGVAATGTITFAAQPEDGNTVTIGTQTYRFKDTMAQANDVKIGADLETTIENLDAAVDLSGTEGVEYYTGTAGVTNVTGTPSSTELDLAYDSVGTAGNAIALAKVGTNITVSGTTLTGGIAANTLSTAWAQLVQDQAIANGKKIFAFACDLNYRDATNQAALASWAVAGGGACFLVSNDTAAYSSTSTADIGSVLTNSSSTGTTLFFSDAAGEYPEVAAMACMLSVDYGGINTVKTLKFKTLTGMTASDITETQWAVLDSKNYNVVAKTGNTSIFVREGKNTAASWFCDDYIGIQNFKEECQVAVFNVFLAKKKVPFTTEGSMMLKAALDVIGNKYVLNGFLADRQIADSESDSGFTVAKAYSFVPTPIYLVSASDRADRKGPSISGTCYLSGAIHKVTVNIDMVQ